MPLFEIVVLRLPTKKESEDGMLETVIAGPEMMVARDSHGAAMMFVRKKGEAIPADDPRLEVLVRPFQ